MNAPKKLVPSAYSKNAEIDVFSLVMLQEITTGG
jgi:hypothetical protein